MLPETEGQAGCQWDLGNCFQQMANSLRRTKQERNKKTLAFGCGTQCSARQREKPTWTCRGQELRRASGQGDWVNCAAEPEQAQDAEIRGSFKVPLLSPECTFYRQF